MRILYSTRESFPTFRVDITELLGHEFSMLGHRVVWVSDCPEPLESLKILRWYKHLVLLVPNCFLGKIRAPSYLVGIIKCFYFFKLPLHKKYDFIQVKDEILTALVGLIIGKLRKTKFIYWLSFPIPDGQIYSSISKPLHLRWLYWARGRFNYFLLYKVIMRCSDLIVAQSEQMKRDLVSLGVSTQKITAIPMGVQLRNTNFEEFVFDAKQNLVIGYLGTLTASRHLDFLVEVLHEVLKEVPDAKLLIVGDGDSPGDRELILNRAKELRIENNIEITGFLEQETAWNRIRQSTVCLSPFYPVSFLLSASPTKLLEYMALGIPSIANEHPEQKKILDESGAGVCVPWDKYEFSKAIMFTHRNPDIAKKMSLKGLPYVKKYRSYENIAKRLERFYLANM